MAGTDLGAAAGFVGRETVLFGGFFFQFCFILFVFS